MRPLRKHQSPPLPGDRLLRFTLPIALAMFMQCAAKLPADDSIGLPPQATQLIEQSCVECHNKNVAEGDVQLDELHQLDQAARLELLTRVQEQVFVGLMPPEDAEALSSSDRRQLVQWLTDKLAQHEITGLSEKRLRPAYGNPAEHDGDLDLKMSRMNMPQTGAIKQFIG